MYKRMHMPCYNTNMPNEQAEQHPEQDFSFEPEPSLPGAEILPNPEQPALLRAGFSVGDVLKRHNQSTNRYEFFEVAQERDPSTGQTKCALVMLNTNLRRVGGPWFTYPPSEFEIAVFREKQEALVGTRERFTPSVSEEGEPVFNFKEKRELLSWIDALNHAGIQPMELSNPPETRLVNMRWERIAKAINDLETLYAEADIPDEKKFAQTIIEIPRIAFLRANALAVTAKERAALSPVFSPHYPQNPQFSALPAVDYLSHEAIDHNSKTEIDEVRPPEVLEQFKTMPAGDLIALKNKYGSTVRYEKMSNGKFLEHIVFTDTGKFRTIFQDVRTETEMLEMVLQNPTSVVISVSEEGRKRVKQDEEQAERGRENILMIDSLPIGGVVIYGNEEITREGKDAFVCMDTETTSTIMQTTDTLEAILRKVSGGYRSVEMKQNGQKEYVKETAEQRLQVQTNLRNLILDIRQGRIKAPIPKFSLPPNRGERKTEDNNYSEFLAAARYDHSKEDVDPELHPLLEAICRSEIKQGPVGDCYLLAAINTLKKEDPEMYLQLVGHNIRKAPDGNGWQVKFPGLLEEIRNKPEPSRTELLGLFDNKEWVTVTPKDLKTHSFAEVDFEVDNIFEVAYNRWLARIKTGKVGETAKLDKNGDYTFEGGFGHRAFRHMLGSDIAIKCKVGNYEGSDGDTNLVSSKHAKQAVDVLNRAASSFGRREYYITLNTQHKKEGKKPSRGDKIQIGRGPRLNYRHAHSGLNINRLNGKLTIEIQDPHDTKEKHYVLSSEEITQYFSQISYVRIIRRYQPLKNSIK